MTTIEIYHGSNEEVTHIHNDGLFGGIFAGSEVTAESHGNVITKFELKESEILTQWQLSYEIDYETLVKLIAQEINISDAEDFLYEAIVEDNSEIIHADTTTDEQIKFIFKNKDRGEASWECQRIRGVIAKKLGYKAVEMDDEHGKVYLIVSL